MLGLRLGRRVVAPSTAGGVSGLSESCESKETMDGVFERLGETIFSSPPQETMRAAMRWRDKRRGVQKPFVHATGITASERP